MSSWKKLASKALCFGVVGAAVFLGAPPSRAQEVSPDHFTDSGVEGVFPPGHAQTKGDVTPRTTKRVAQTRYRSAAARKGRLRKVARMQKSSELRMELQRSPSCGPEKELIVDKTAGRLAHD